MRLPALDLIRGVAVLGILAVNVAGFAAPGSAAYSPGPPDLPTSFANHAAYLVTLVLFEGKMRALFSVLFGASLLLLVERADATGPNGAVLQMRRLFWLLLIGYGHFALLWDGDILFLYAVMGFIALALRQWQPRQWVTAAALIFALWQVWGAAQWAPSVLQENFASPAGQIEHAKILADFRADDARDRAEAKLSWPAEIAARMSDRADGPLRLAAYNWGETLPWMLLGMALLRSGFFAGAWPRRRMAWLAGTGLGLGGAATLAFAVWAEAYSYPEVTMHYALSYGLALPHLAMALGYAALLVLVSPLLLSSPAWRGRGGGGGSATALTRGQAAKLPQPQPLPDGAGGKEPRSPRNGGGLIYVLAQQIEAAGRMAFSNYLATSLIMGALCSGWGLGLFDQFGAAQRWTLVLLGWALMLSWSQPWLTRYRQGPLEWAWRSLTELRWLAFRR